MVAERTECVIDASMGGKNLGRSRSVLPALLARLNDKSIILLQQIFLECHDSFSSFRFAVFLSSKFSPMMHKFVMDDKVAVAKSKREYVFDVCIYGRQSGDLIAVGMQNNIADQQTSDNKSSRRFLDAVEDMQDEYPSLRGAYYASSYGYDGNSDPSGQAKRKGTRGKKDANERTMEIMFFKYKDKVYFEVK